MPVDTGKTSLLDRIRGTAVQLREAGGITQQIGASFFPTETLAAITQQLMKSFKVSIKIPGLLVIDTPGHEAFANLRRRGGSVADLSILVVDVTHGFENQTYESIDILRSRRTPFIVAANKIDLIPGWRSTPDSLFMVSYSRQEPAVREDLDNRLYNIMGALSTLGFKSDRFDRVRDFTRNVAIVPVSAKTGEGIGELIAILIGLTQQYLQEKLMVTQGPARGTVLEVKEEVGLGTTINAIIYDGVLRQGDTIIVGGKEGAIATGVRAILMPQPLDEIRDPRKRFINIAEASAAAGIKIVAPNLENAVPGAPLIAVGEGVPLERALEEVASEVARIRFYTDKVGIVLKSDTLGSLEALIDLFRARGIPIRLADIGDVSKRDVVEAVAVRYEEPLYGAILAFNVRVLPDAEREARAEGIPIFKRDVIYNLIDDYFRWLEAERDAKEKREFDALIKPGKIEVLEGFIFRRSNPAIFGVKVLAGAIAPNREMINMEGEVLGRITQIQEEGKPISLAEEGKEVAVSMPKPIIGRHIKEGDILYVDVPEEHVRVLRDRFSSRLTERALETLKELVEIKRRRDPVWAM
ncbi:MAG: translation initiation factor IF-2 [Candidatus Bathyarchaeia archaeon]|nr:translation initiation factor IF-2 [Candidatus Bathyarchaeota archaeon]